MQPLPFKPSLRMTFETAQGDWERLLRYCRTSKETLVSLDLSEVTHCDSAGLALLIEAKRLCREQNKTWTLVDIPKSVHALAEFCGVDAILGLC